jgi:hypothetical protein
MVIKDSVRRIRDSVVKKASAEATTKKKSPGLVQVVRNRKKDNRSKTAKKARRAQGPNFEGKSKGIKKKKRNLRLGRTFSPV